MNYNKKPESKQMLDPKRYAFLIVKKTPSLRFTIQINFNSELPWALWLWVTLSGFQSFWLSVMLTLFLLFLFNTFKKENFQLNDFTTYSSSKSTLRSLINVQSVINVLGDIFSKKNKRTGRKISSISVQGWFFSERLRNPLDARNQYYFGFDTSTLVQRKYYK